MLDFLKKIFGSPPEALSSLAAVQVDMHSHILPGLDDGSETIEVSLNLLKEMENLGYRKLIMTPHIMGDFYKNTPEGIRQTLQELRTAAVKAGIKLQLECAAEYYLDEWFVRKLEDGEELLTFGQNYLLFETSYINKPGNLQEIVFMMKAAGYQPVLAHPERYTYLYGRFEELVELRNDGVLLQLNLNSLAGYYSKGAKHVAEKLIRNKMVDLVGSDLHGMKHVQALRKVLQTKEIRQVLDLPLINPHL